MIEYMKHLRGKAVALAALAGFAASPALAQQPIKIVEGAPPSITVADFYVAEDAGFLKQEGLKLEINFAPNGAVGTQIAANGQADIADVTMEPYIAGFDKGMRGKFIAARGNINIYFLAVPKGGAYKSMADLKGKKIGVVSMGSSAIYYIKSMARAAGMDPQADMFLPVGFGDSAVAAFKAGQVQALALNLVAYAGLVRAGLDFDYIYHPTIRDAGNYGYFVSEAALNGKRDQVVGFMRALIKTDIFIRTNPAAALKIFWKYHPNMKPAGSEADAIRLGTVELAYAPVGAEGLRPERVSMLDKTALDRMLKAMQQEEMFKPGFAVDDLADTTVFQSAAAGVDVAAIQKLAREWKN